MSEEVKKLPPGNLRLEAGQKYLHPEVVMPAGWAFEEALKPEFWERHAHLFAASTDPRRDASTGSKIYIVAEDLAWAGEVFVRAADEKSLHVSVYKEPVYFGPKDVETDTYETRWNLGVKGHDVVRKSDRSIVQSGRNFPKKEDAIRWIEETTGQRVAA